MFLNNSDEEIQAKTANGFGAEMYIGLQIENDSYCAVSYFKTKNSQSEGGFRLASHCSKAITQIMNVKPLTSGMQLPILRATKMPAVVCALGPPGEVVEKTNEIATGLTKAISNWFKDPLEVAE